MLRHVGFGIQPCCIFQPAFGCCAPQTLVKILIFSVFLLKSFWGNKTFDQHFGYSANLKKQFFAKFCTKIVPFLRFWGNKTFDQHLVQHFFVKFCCKFLAVFSFFSFKPLNMLHLHISTSVCSAHHPNAGQNIQHFRNVNLPYLCQIYIFYI